MTSYTLEPGYQSGYSSSVPRDAVWSFMKKAAESICADPARIVAEARAFNAPESCKHSPGCCTLTEYAERYRLPCEDATIAFLEDENGPRIYMAASGDREVKEHIRRAFCRLMIYEMHRVGIEINLIVS